MGLLKGFYLNTRKPKGMGGRLMLSMMNAGHNPNALWGMSQTEIPPDASILDVGCGGGQNIKNLLVRAPRGHVTGVDYSSESVAKSRRFNRKAILAGRAAVQEANVAALPFPNGSFDMATAFETIYFWPDIVQSFAQVRRVLKPGSIFLLCNEAARPKDFEKWIDMLGMTVYTGDELSVALQQAGFSDIVVHTHENGRWLCVTARNSVPEYAKA